MLPTASLRRWFTASPRATRRPRSIRPTLEPLETREVLSNNIVFTGANNIASFVGVGFQNNLVTGLAGEYANGTNDPNIGDFSVQVNWGDGTGWTAATLAPNTGGGNYPNYLVKGSHIYAQTGDYTIEVEGTGPGGTGTGPTVINSATVSDMPSGLPGLPPPPVVSPYAPTNVSLSLTGANNIFSFTGVGFQLNAVTGLNGYLNNQNDTHASDFQAFINWGDSSGWTAATIASDNGGSASFLVKGGHVYNQAGQYDIVVYAIGPDGTTLSKQIDSATVSDLPSGFLGTTPPPVTSPQAPANVTLSLTGATNISSFTGVGFQLNAITGFSGTLNSQNDTHASDFHAFINWGDGSGWTAAVIASNNGGAGTFLIKGSHVYNQAGQYDIVVYAIGADGTTQSEQINSATVSDLPNGVPGAPPPPVTSPQAPANVYLSMTGATNISAVAGVGFQNVNVTGLNGYLNNQSDAHVTDFHAFINWGDGSGWTAATIVLNGNGGGNPSFFVEGGHVYNQAGQFDIVVYAVGPDGTTLSEEINSATVTISPNPTSAVVANFPGAGVWRSLPTTGWQQLASANASLLAIDANGDVAADFQGYGVYRYTSAAGWRQLAAADASSLGIDAAGDVFAAFPGAGVYRYQTSTGWKVLATANASALAVDANGDVAADLAGSGVYLYTAALGGWRQLAAANASVLAIDNNEDVAADFLGYGVYRYTNAVGWRQLAAADASQLSLDAAGDVAAAFQGAGVYRYTSAGGWQQLAAATPTAITMDQAGDVYADFAGAGFYEFQVGVGWGRKTAADASVIAAS